MTDKNIEQTPASELIISIGLKPDELEAKTISRSVSVESAESLAQHQLVLSNHSTFNVSNIKATVSYFDAAGAYLDYEDIEFESLRGIDQVKLDLNLKAPSKAATATLDISGDKQTFFKRHWRVISTVAILAWIVVILARRLGPSFTE